MNINFDHKAVFVSIWNSTEFWVYCILKGDSSSWNFIYFCTPSVQKKQFGFMVRASFAVLLLYLKPFAFKQQIASIAILHPIYEQDHRNNHLLFTYF